MNHFEELWEYSESLSTDDDSLEVISELEIKLTILKNIIKSDLSGESRQAAVAIAYGALLKTLTSISKKENINVFASLKNSLEGEEGF